MFMLNEILVFSPGRRQEGLDRLSWIHGLMVKHEGFVGAVVAKYLGAGTRHTVLRLWQDEDAYRAFRASEDGNYGRGRPEGLYVNEPVVAQWNTLSVQMSGTPGPYLVKLQGALPEDAWPAFEAHEAAVEAAASGLGLSQQHMSLRAADRSEAMSMLRLADRAALERLLESPEYAASRAATPGAAEFSTQCFEIVSEVVPGR